MSGYEIKDLSHLVDPATGEVVGVKGANDQEYFFGKESNTVLDLGDISGAVNIDLSYSAIKFNLTGNATFTFTNPPASGVNRPTTFYGTRTSGSNAVLSFAQSVSWVGSQVSPSILDVQTTVFSVSTINAGTSYFGFANGLVIETTASGRATTWNPSDSSPQFTLTAGNTQVERTVLGSTTDFRSLRAFGGKASGKHRFSVRVDKDMIGSNNWLLLGVADASMPLNVFVGSTATGYAFGVNASNQWYKWNNRGAWGAGTVLGATVAETIGTILGVLVDLDANKIWFTRDSSVIGGGDPEAGTGQDYSLNASPIYFPTLTIAESSGDAGQYSLLNEVQDPYANTWPSFNTWTA